MAKFKVPLISIVGTSKTGKTTLIEGLLPLFKKDGLRMATIKHHHLDFEFDIEGKDTQRHKSAGASTVVLSSPHKLAFIKDLNDEMPLRDIVSTYIDDVDFIICEGYKKEDIPKIEVFRHGKGKVPLCMTDPSILAIVTDKPVDTGIPQFKADDYRGIAVFVNRTLNLARRAH
ncbi:MAG TPA: molybdopterin-guanine dinucleotide biosynthesis protein B [Syntrophorhabdaceae bacterium]|nr:molybdopterin-guanine dinucleotide biosynthesis protein B [Syntrophorhabdaceae bacterium]